MQARSAYISSLSTTAIMVASALLMLAMLGAIVGFKGWPRGHADEPIDPIGVPVQPTHLATAAKLLPSTRRPRAAAPVPTHAAPAPAAPPAQSAPAVHDGSPAATDTVRGPSMTGAPERGSGVSPAPAPHVAPQRQPPPPSSTPAPTDQVRDAIAPVIAPVTTAVGPANAPSTPPVPAS